MLCTAINIMATSAVMLGNLLFVLSVACMVFAFYTYVMTLNLMCEYMMGDEASGEKLIQETWINLAASIGITALSSLAKPILRSILKNKLIKEHGKNAAKAIKEYGDDAVDAMKKGIDSDLIKQLDELGIKPKDYAEHGIAGWEAAEKAIESSTKVLSKPSSKVLRQNLINAGLKVPDYPNVAHHIVAGNSPKAAEARAILQKYGVDINNAANGTFLPTVKDVAEGAYHPSLHTNAYYDEINSLLSDVTSKQEALDVLKYISESLQDGTFMK